MMKSFLKSTACNGRRPKKTKPGRRVPRAGLMTRLVAERFAARFLIAPVGYGKTSLALDYADAMFDFQNVYWVDASNVCFMRDIDAGVVSSTLLALTEEPSLAVFEDVPFLEGERCTCFSRELDALLDAGWEIIATTTPVFAGIGYGLCDRMVIGARDFLVGEQEFLSSDDAAGVLPLLPCDRVPALVWGNATDVAAFARGMRAGNMPAALRMPLLAMTVLGEGTLDDVTVTAGDAAAEDLAFLAEHYPHAGVDVANEAFRAHMLSTAELAEAFGSRGTARDAHADAIEDVAAKAATLLLARAEYDRACGVMERLCSRDRRRAWLEAHQVQLFDGGALIEAQRTFDSLGTRTTGYSTPLLMGAAERLWMLGDRDGAASLAARVMASPTALREQAFEAALMCLRHGSSEARKRASGIVGAATCGVESPSASEGAMPHVAQALVAFAEAGEGAMAVSLVGHERALAASRPAKGFLLACCEHAAASREDIDESIVQMFAATAAEVAREGVAAARSVYLLEALLADVAARLGADPPFVGSSQAHASDMAASTERQRARYILHMKQQASRREGKRLKQAEAPEPERIPEMRVRLFGGMEVSVDGKLIDPRAFSKQQTKTLLAVLVLFRGREVPRQELIRILWPGSTKKRATNNFYALWSALRKALGAGKNDVCPYLIRHQSSCMIDARYVRSDLDEFDALCRSFFFEEPDAQGWLESFDRMEHEFSSDLLPSETRNDYIAMLRDKLRGRRVDAYVTACTRLCDAGEPAASLWFARAAHEASPEREDAYFALMRAQALAGQRTQAMTTYRECGVYMSEHLGIDPSDRMRRLYENLLHDGDAAVLA